jgi:hypothetical protein
MPGFERDQQAIDNTVENRRLGSVMLTAGWILLWFDAILLVYFFTSIRDGTYFWPIWTTIQAAVGLALVLAGTRFHRVVGASHLGQLDMHRTQRQQLREEREQHHVA